MAIQEYVSGEEFKKLIDDKIINANSVKYIIKNVEYFPYVQARQLCPTLFIQSFLALA